MAKACPNQRKYRILDPNFPLAYQIAATGLYWPTPEISEISGPSEAYHRSFEMAISSPELPKFIRNFVESGDFAMATAMIVNEASNYANFQANPRRSVLAADRLFEVCEWAESEILKDSGHSVATDAAFQAGTLAVGMATKGFAEACEIAPKTVRKIVKATIRGRLATWRKPADLLADFAYNARNLADDALEMRLDFDGLDRLPSAWKAVLKARAVAASQAATDGEIAPNLGDFIDEISGAGQPDEQGHREFRQDRAEAREFGRDLNIFADWKAIREGKIASENRDIRESLTVNPPELAKIMCDFGWSWDHANKLEKLVAAARDAAGDCEIAKDSAEFDVRVECAAKWAALPRVAAALKAHFEPEIVLKSREVRDNSRGMEMARDVYLEAISCGVREDLALELANEFAKFDVWAARRYWLRLSHEKRPSAAVWAAATKCARGVLGSMAYGKRQKYRQDLKYFDPSDMADVVAVSAIRAAKSLGVSATWLVENIRGENDILAWVGHAPSRAQRPSMRVGESKWLTFAECATGFTAKQWAAVTTCAKAALRAIESGKREMPRPFATVRREARKMAPRFKFHLRGRCGAVASGPGAGIVAIELPWVREARKMASRLDATPRESSASRWLREIANRDRAGIVDAEAVNALRMRIPAAPGKPAREGRALTLPEATAQWRVDCLVNAQAAKAEREAEAAGARAAAAWMASVTAKPAALGYAKRLELTRRVRAALDVNAAIWSDKDHRDARRQWIESNWKEVAEQREGTRPLTEGEWERLLGE
jgi:hypothetical protein